MRNPVLDARFLVVGDAGGVEHGAWCIKPSAINPKVPLGYVDPPPQRIHRCFRGAEPKDLTGIFQPRASEV